MWGRCCLQFEKQHVKSNFNKDNGKIEIEFFRGGKTNIAYNCLDRHVKQGRGDQPCFLWEGNEMDQSRAMTYKEVLEEVSRLVSCTAEIIGHNARNSRVWALDWSSCCCLLVHIRLFTQEQLYEPLSGLAVLRPKCLQTQCTYCTYVA